jgi:hypothetical protein
MRRLFISLVIVLLALSAATMALDASEEAALESLWNAYPALRRVNPVEQYQYIAPEDYDWGGSWTQPIADACIGGPGWQRHGIHCDLDGHISGIRFSCTLQI